MHDLDGFIWMDGKFVDWRKASVHVLTHTLHYGTGVFEGIRAYSTKQGAAIFRLEEHIDRLFQSARIIGMDLPFTKKAIQNACIEVVVKNKLKAGYIRPLCFFEAKGLGLRAENLTSRVAIAAWDWGAYLGEEALKKGIKVKTSSFARHHVNVMMCKVKSTANYLNSFLALKEAVDCGFDEALMLDTQGYVAEGSGENIFIVNRNKLITPPAVLDGITRDTVMQLCEKLSLPVIERNITRDEIYTADEAFFTGTAAEITPISSLDNKIIRRGIRGPITEQLQKLYFDIVHGEIPAYKDWLSVVK